MTSEMTERPEKESPGFARRHAFGLTTLVLIGILLIAISFAGLEGYKAIFAQENDPVRNAPPGIAQAIQSEDDFRTAARAGNIASVSFTYASNSPSRVPDEIIVTVTMTDESMNRLGYADSDIRGIVDENGILITPTEETPNHDGAAMGLGVLALVTLILLLTHLNHRDEGGLSSVFRKKEHVLTQTDEALAPPTVTFADVAGLREAKEAAQDFLSYLKDPEHFAKVGAEPPNSLLLFGPPGSGKTLFARAIAGEANVPFIETSGSEFIRTYTGTGAQSARNLEAKAVANAPCIVFIDELDGVGQHRTKGIGGSGEAEQDRTVDALLKLMDHLAEIPGILVIGATNYRDKLDAALRRSGRFGRQIKVPTPDETQRRAILAIHARGKALAEDVDPAEIAAGTSGFSGAGLKALLNEAALTVAREKRGVITQDDIKGSVRKVAESERARGRLTVTEDQKVTLDDIGGLSGPKSAVESIPDFIRNIKLYLALGAKLPKGFLFYGDPGTGKTLLAKALAYESGLAVIVRSGSEFVEKWAGVGAARIRETFEEAHEHGCCIVVIDEIDAVGKHRGSDGNSEREQTLNQLLVEMDGMHSSEGIIVIGITNRPEMLDPALRRRLKEEVFFPPPDLEEREAILRIHMRKRPMAKNVNLHEIALQTWSMSGDDLAGLANQAALCAGRARRKAIAHKDLREAIDIALAGRETTRAMLDDDKTHSAHHEVGHALPAHVLLEAHTPHEMTNRPRSKSAAHVLTAPDADASAFWSYERCFSQIVVSIGGMAAEELYSKNGRAGSGPQGDLPNAKHIAKMMVYELGMSEEIGPVVIANGEVISEDMRARADAAVRRILDEAKAVARAILKDYEDMWRRVAGELKEKETIRNPEIIAELFSDTRRVSVVEYLARVA